MKYFKIKNTYECCRVCKSKKIINFFHIDSLPMPEGHTKEEETPFVHDIDIFWCSECEMVQTQVDLDLDEYYQEYTYTTGSSILVDKYMDLVAKTLISKYNLPNDSLIVEVGSGDGAQLSKFKKYGMSVVGVEPSRVLADSAKVSDIDTIVEMFTSDTIEEIRSNYGSASMVIIQYTFDHLTDPSSFVHDVHNLLLDTGLLVIEVHDFEKIYSRNEACLFTHEHSIYPSIESISNLLQIHGMKIIDTSIVSEELRRGNSMAIVAAKNSSSLNSITMANYTKLPKFRNKKTYDDFEKKIVLSHQALKMHIEKLISKGLKVAGYGAAARGVDTLVIAGINNNHLCAIYDKNTSFMGKTCPYLEYLSIVQINYI